MDPLKSRALPGSLWEHVPSSWQAQEELWRQKIATVNVFEFPWKQMRWLTESDAGLFLTLVLFCATWFCLRRPKGSLQFTLYRLGAFLLLLGAADFLSNGIKLWIGRFKPHVHFYSTLSIPALSMPSNHAFNGAFICALMWGWARPARTATEKFFFATLLIYVLCLGYTRILFSQHYPSDVLLGWLLGFVFGYASSRLVRIIFRAGPHRPL